MVVYDLEAVLQCSWGDASDFYYVSKINAYHFTFNELNAEKPNVLCYLWDETQAKRGANEIGTCVLKYIESLRERDSVKNGEKLNVISYSNNCCGQQKNCFMLLVYLFSVTKYPFVNYITHKFLVKRHSQNEGDSVYSVIESTVTKSLKSGPICIPPQYATLIRTAKKTGEPYQVEEMSYDSFFNVKDLAAQSLITNSLKDSNDEVVKIMSVSVFRFEMDKPRTIFFKASYSQEDFGVLNLKE